jgi:hypothetical protein
MKDLNKLGPQDGTDYEVSSFNNPPTTRNLKLFITVTVKEKS